MEAEAGGVGGEGVEVDVGEGIDRYLLNPLGTPVSFKSQQTCIWVA